MRTILSAVAKPEKLQDRLIRHLSTISSRLAMSARAYDRILKVARTIAGLDASVTVRQPHIMEAIAAAATSTAPTTSTCNVFTLWTKTYSQNYIKFSDYIHQFYVKFGD